MQHSVHQPVMLNEVINGLSIQPEGVYVDATFGRGGHSRAILSALGPKGRLFAYDKDPEAVAYAESNIEDDRFEIRHDSYKAMLKDLLSAGMQGRVNGVLMDLGLSSPQIDVAARGFSFMAPGPLDMRMNPKQPLSAKVWLAETSETEIADALYYYGEERLSRSIARAIVRHREAAGDIETTQDLVAIIKSAVGGRYQKEKHPATRTFQAIRIVVNAELEELECCLSDALIDLLAVGARLVVISFHSIEHRLVRKFMQRYLPGNETPEQQMSLAQTPVPRLKRVGRTLTPSVQELADNVRCRSAQCRIVEKLAC